MSNKIESMNRVIDSYYPENNFSKPIYDGFMNYDKYRDSKIKILWVLKEAYDSVDEDTNAFGGGWHLGEMLEKRRKLTSPTHIMMAQISHCINKDIDKTEKKELDNIRMNVNSLNDMLSTAYINVKKYPGKTKSNAKDISRSYSRTKDLLFRQINIIAPDIILFGVGDLFDLEIRNDLLLERQEMKWVGKASYYNWGNRLIIEVQHPGMPGNDKAIFINDILAIVNSWREGFCLTTASN